MTNERPDQLAPDHGSSFTSPRRFAANVLSNTAMLLLNIVVGLWFTPYLIGHLGAALYGLVPLATSVTSYMSVVDRALSGAVGRFLTLDIRQQRTARANETFNTAFWTSIALGVLLLPVALLVSLNVHRLFNVPAGFESQASLLFVGVMVTYLIGMTTSVFGVSAFAQNRLDLQNVTLAVSLLVRVGVVVLLFSLFQPRVWLVGLGLLLGGLVGLFLAGLFWRILTPELSIHLSAFSRARLSVLFSMSGWMLIMQIGSLLFLSLDLIIVNLFLGAEAGGRYGSVLQWSFVLRSLANTMAATLTPIVLAKYASGDLAGMTALSRQAVKLLGLAMAFPVGVVCGFSQPLLTIWLGNDFTDLALLMSVLTIHLSINLAILPVLSIFVTLNKVRWPGIVSLTTGLLNLGLALWWVGFDERGLGVAVAGAVVLSLKNAVFSPLYGASIQSVKWHTYYSPLLYAVIGGFGIAFLGYLVAANVALESWLSLGLAVALMGLGYGLVVFAVFLNRADRQLLARFVPQRLFHGA